MEDGAERRAGRRLMCGGRDGVFAPPILSPSVSSLHSGNLDPCTASPGFSGTRASGRFGPREGCSEPDLSMRTDSGRGQLVIHAVRVPIGECPLQRLLTEKVESALLSASSPQPPGACSVGPREMVLGPRWVGRAACGSTTWTSQPICPPPGLSACSAVGRQFKAPVWHPSPGVSDANKTS